MSAASGHGCESRYDDLAAYALGSLEPEQGELLQRHLDSCPACAERLEWLRPAVDLVPAGVAQHEPPAELGDRLMEIVRREAAESSGAGAVADARRAGPLARLRDALRAPGRPGLLARPAMAGLAALAIIAAGLGGYALSGGEESLRSYAAMPTSPKLAATGTVEVRDGSGTLLVRDLPTIPSDEVYQVWVRHDQVLAPSSVFVLAHDGSATAAIPDLPDAADEILVTREPAGGSEEPHSAPVLSARID